MKKALQILLAAFGATDILIALLHIALGPSAIPGSVPVNATMDSEDRFYATLFAAYGAAVLWCVPGIARKHDYIRLLALVFFIGGLARLVSMLAVGLPNNFFVLMTGLELALPLLMVWMLSKIPRAAE